MNFVEPRVDQLVIVEVGAIADGDPETVWIEDASNLIAVCVSHRYRYDVGRHAGRVNLA